MAGNKVIRKSALTIIPVALALSLLISPAVADYTSEEWQRMKDGEVIFVENPEGSQKVQFVAKFYIKAPRKQVWRIMRDYDKFDEFLPNVQETKVVNQEGSVYWVEYTTKVLWIETNYTLRFDGVKKHGRVEVSLDKSRPHDRDESRGWWEFEDAPNGKGTVVTHSNYVKTGIPAPESIARKLSKASFPKMARNVRKRVESGGTWKKNDTE